jgi:hypothetical protein
MGKSAKPPGSAATLPGIMPGTAQDHRAADASSNTAFLCNRTTPSLASSMLKAGLVTLLAWLLAGALPSP